MKIKRTSKKNFYSNIDGKKIICFGYTKHMDTFKRFMGDDTWQKNIVFIVDNNVKLQNTEILLNDRKVSILSPNVLLGQENSIILIMLGKSENVIAVIRQLMEMRISDTVECYACIDIENEVDINDTEYDNCSLSNKLKVNKIIHSCWFSKEPKPKMYQDCIDSWKRFCPDYSIMEWNADNYDITKNQYMKQAFEKKKWAFVSDYARLDLVYQYGGIYLDMDVEVLKSLDELLRAKAFFAIDNYGLIDLGSGFGAEKGLEFIRKLLQVYDHLDYQETETFGNIKGEIAQPTRLLPLFEEFGFKKQIDTQYIKDVLFLSTNFIKVLDDPLHERRKFNGKEFAIHWHNAGWKNDEYIKKKVEENQKRYEFIDYYDTLLEN